MTEIRINMVVSADEHPELYALLSSKPPKTRASILRQCAEFGLWVKRQGPLNPSLPPSNSVQYVPDVINPQITNPPPERKEIENPLKVGRVAVKEASNPISETPSGAGVLDSSMLAGVNFGDLD